MDIHFMFPIGLYLLNLISIIVIVFIRRKKVETSYAWIMLLVFLPVVGYILYFFLGSTKKLEMVNRRSDITEEEQKYIENLQMEISQMMKEEMRFKNEAARNYEDIIRANTKNAGCFFTEDNKIELLVNGQEKFPKLFEDMRNAKHSINVMYFIFKTHDEVGKEFLKILEEKAKEGVKIKVMYDGLGCLKTRISDFDTLIANGGMVQRFLPSIIKTFATANYRLHRKMVIIDGKICYTGGINVGDDYLGKYEHITPWRDTSVKLIGSAVNELQLIFFKDWAFCAMQDKKMRESFEIIPFLEEMQKEYFPKPDYNNTGGVGCQIVEGDPTSYYAAHRDSYFKMCTSAKKYLYIQTPYFVPDEGLLDAIRIAAQSGIDVRLMIPGIPDKNFVYKVTLSYIEELLKAGVKVYTHNGFIHAKTIVMDDYVASIGTTNFDIRSFKLDYEVNVISYDNDFAIKCRDTFIEDINDSKEVVLEEFMKRGKLEYIQECLYRFLAPLY